MKAEHRRWWPVVKVLMGLAILLAVGWRFGRDLSRPELYAQPVRVGWLAGAGILYVVALALSGLYWHRLLTHLGYSPGRVACLRAYFISQPGKYVPGKAWAVVLRVGLVRGYGVPASLGGLTTFVEVLTTMAAGAGLAAGLFALFGPLGVTGALGANLWGLLRQELSAAEPVDRRVLVTASLLLTAVTLGPILPGVFNRLVGRLSVPFRTGPVPQLRLLWLAEGILWLVPSWGLLGLALGCAFAAVPGAGLAWDLPTWARLTAAMGLSYVAGFLLFTPGGLGVREYLLGVVLAPEVASCHGADPEAARARVILSVLLLRVAWTLAELLMAVALTFAPTKPVAPRAAGLA